LKRYGGELDEPELEELLVDERLENGDFYTDELIGDEDDIEIGPKEEVKSEVQEEIEEDDSGTSYHTCTSKLDSDFDFNPEEMEIKIDSSKTSLLKFNQKDNQ